MEAGVSGSTTAPSPRDESRHHSVAFVRKDDKVWELNKDTNAPLPRGKLEDEDLLSERGLAMTVQDYLHAEPRVAMMRSVSSPGKKEAQSRIGLEEVKCMWYSMFRVMFYIKRRNNEMSIGRVFA